VRLADREESLINLFLLATIPGEEFRAVGNSDQSAILTGFERMVSERHRLIALSSTGYSNVAVPISYDQFCFSFFKRSAAADTKAAV
jgi:hypothetical protein